MPERFHIRVITAGPLARLTIWSVAFYALWQGVGIMLGGPGRFGGPSFAVLRLAPNPTLLWGIWLSMAGLAILTGSVGRNWWVKMGGLVAVAIWSAVFAIGAYRAVTDNPTMAATGYKTYALIAWVSVILVFLDERRRSNAGR